MRLKNYREDLLERLKDEDYAAEYLARVLAENDKAAFLVALKDVVEATGGMSVMARRAGLKRPSLYKVFSKRGNPHLGDAPSHLGGAGPARHNRHRQNRLNPGTVKIMHPGEPETPAKTAPNHPKARSELELLMFPERQRRGGGDEQPTLGQWRKRSMVPG